MISIQKFLKVSFVTINLVLTLVLIYNFEANKVYLILFSLLLNYYFFISFNKDIHLIHFFVSFFFWVGFWIKLCFSNIETVYSLELFRGIGNFYYEFYNPDNLYYTNKTLLVSIIGVAGFVSSLLFQRYFYPNSSNKNFGMNKNLRNFQLFYQNNKKIIITLFIISFLVIGLVNFNFSIYQRGITGNSEVGFIISSLFKWLLLFGFTSFSAIFIFHSLYGKKISIKVLILAICENFISSVSMLSRGMFVNSMAIIFGLYKYMSINNQKFLTKKYLFLIFFSCILFFFSILIVKDLRAIKYSGFFEHSIHNKINNNKSNNSSRIKIAISEIFLIISNRFVGIEQVHDVVKNSSDLNFNLLIESLKEKKNYNKLTFFDEKIKKSLFDENQDISNNKTYFINVPGIIAYLYYSGSYLFLFLLSFLIGIILSLFEKMILLIFGNNYLLASLISQTLAYRINNFGYIPSNTYLILITIILNLVIIYTIYVFTNKYSQK